MRISEGKAVEIALETEVNFSSALDTFYICPACAQINSTENANIFWILYIILMLFFYTICVVSLVDSTPNTSVLLLAGLGFLLKLYIGISMVVRIGFSSGKETLLVYSQFIPVVGDIAFLSQQKKIYLHQECVSALKPRVERYYTQYNSEEEEVQKQPEKDEEVNEEILY